MPTCRVCSKSFEGRAQGALRALNSHHLEMQQARRLGVVGSREHQVSWREAGRRPGHCPGYCWDSGSRGGGKFWCVLG